jgi:FdhE protein
MNTNKSRTTDCDALVRVAEAKWDTALRDRPDLEVAITLQRRLINLSIKLISELESLGLPNWTMSTERICIKLNAGIPILRGENIPLPVDILTPALLGFCNELAQSDAKEAVSHLISVLQQHRIDPGSLVAASLARNQHAIRTTSVHIGLSPDLVWLVAELATVPAAFVLQQKLFEPSKKSKLNSIHTAMANWNGKGCPACGSWPALAEIRYGHRDLRCSFCGISWSTAILKCVYCGGHEHGIFEIIMPDREKSIYQIELCKSCQGYLKSVDVTTTTPGPLIPITDLATTDLDFTATARGYVRPELSSINSENSCI